MIGIITSPINIRFGMSKTSADMGNLSAGDVVVGPLIDGWIAFDRVYRKTIGSAAAEVLGFTRYAAVYEPGNLAQKYMMLVDVAMPVPAPTPVPTQTAKPFTLSVEGPDYESVVVEVRPK